MREIFLPDTSQWQIDEECIDSIYDRAFNQLQIINVVKEHGITNVARTLIVLFERKRIDHETLINYYMILTAMLYNNSEVSVAYNPKPESEIGSPHNAFLLYVQVTKETVGSIRDYGDSCSPYIPGSGNLSLKTLEAELFFQLNSRIPFINPYNIKYEYRFLSLNYKNAKLEFDVAPGELVLYSKIDKLYFGIPSFSVMKSLLIKEGYSVASSPSVYFEPFSPEAVLTNLANGKRPINLPPLYESKLDSKFNGKVHRMDSDWFGVVLHDLYFHWPMECRSSPGLKNFRAAVVKATREIAKDQTLLTQFLWRDVIDFEHYISSPQLLEVANFLMNQLEIMGTPRYPECKNQIHIEQMVCFLMASEDEINVLDHLIKESKKPVSSAFSLNQALFIDTVKRVRSLSFSGLSEVESLRVKTLYLFLFVKNKITRETMPDQEIIFLQSVTELLGIPWQFEGKRFLNAIGDFNKHPDTKQLIVQVNPLTLPQQKQPDDEDSASARGSLDDQKGGADQANEGLLDTDTDSDDLAAPDEIVDDDNATPEEAALQVVMGATKDKGNDEAPANAGGSLDAQHGSARIGFSSGLFQRKSASLPEAVSIKADTCLQKFG